MVLLYVKLIEINIRDPFILPHEGKYYMFGSRVGNPADGGGWGRQLGFDVYVSDNLQDWSEPKAIFEKNDAFWGEREFWAPEVHAYNGKFYLFASFKADGKCRGTHILVCDTPDGQYQPVSAAPATPADWECLDGTLYVDKTGKPYIVFCHEWVQIGDGTVCAIELSEDLSTPVSAPMELWRASDYVNVKSVTEKPADFVTDGPFMFRNAADELLCIWSTFNENGYTELISKSDNGEIDGNWTILPQPLSSKDGGHGMIFRTFCGKECFIMHKPNTATLERPVISLLHQENGRLFIQE